MIKKDSLPLSHSISALPQVTVFLTILDDFYTVLDLGDPDIIFPTSSSYVLYIYASDRNLEDNIEHQVASFEISFKNNKPVEEALDSHHEKQEDIIVTPVVQKKANIMVKKILIFLID